MRIARLLCVLLVLAPAVLADDVTTKSGRVYTDLTLVKETKSHYIFEDARGRTLRLSKASIEKIDKKPTVRGTFRERHEALTKEDIDGRLALARWAKENGLDKEVGELCDEILGLAPDHAGAHELRGDRFVDGAWVSEKDWQRAREKMLKARYERLGWTKVNGEWMSPVEAHRQKAKMEEISGVWVTAKEAQEIEREGLQYRLGGWYGEKDRARLDGDLRKVDGQWVAIDELDTRARKGLGATVVAGQYVEVHSNARYTTAEEALGWAEDTYLGLVKSFGMVHPDLYEKRGRLIVFLGRDPESYSNTAAGAKMSDFVAAMSSCYGTYPHPTFADGRGAAPTFYHNATYTELWVRLATTLAYLDRFGARIDGMDPGLVVALAGYGAGLTAEGYQPSRLILGYFDPARTDHSVRPSEAVAMSDPRKVSGMEPRERDRTYEPRPLRGGLFIHFALSSHREAFMDFLLDEALHGPVPLKSAYKSIFSTDDNEAIDKAFQAWFQPWYAQATQRK